MVKEGTMKQLSVTLLILAATFSSAQDISGDWNGTLKVGAAELRLVLHISKSAEGNLKASLDSIDQGANGIPVSAVTLNESKLSLKVDAVNGTYDGNVNADASEIAGTWTQGQSFVLDFHRGGVATRTAKPAPPSDIDGDWLGTLDTGLAKLRLILHIANTDQGLSATMDSLDQNAKGLPVTVITRSGPLLKFEMKSIGGGYDGTIAKDLGSITGTWSQTGKSWPLTLKKVKNAAELERRRPQNRSSPIDIEEPFQTAKTGAASEYSEIAETMSRMALEKIANRILKVSAGS
jgi:hypothetical protein